MEVLSLAVIDFTFGKKSRWPEKHFTFPYLLMHAQTVKYLTTFYCSSQRSAARSVSTCQ